jgi:DNA-directed RNA polymerase specialized sigma24 family protein
VTATLADDELHEYTWQTGASARRIVRYSPHTKSERSVLFYVLHLENYEFVMREPLLESLLEHQAVKAWSQLGPERIEPVAVEVVKPKRRSALYRLVGVGTGGSAVLAKKCPAATAAVEKSIYLELLPRLPCPTLRCYGWVKEPQDDWWWQFVEDLEGLEYSPLSDEHRELAGRWLGTVHSAAMRTGFDVRLPRRDPSHYLRLLRTSRARLKDLLTNPALSKEDLQVLRRITSQCDIIESRWDELENLCSELPRTLVHGDFVAKNVRVKITRSGPAFVVFDWGIAGWGVPATDLAQFTGRTVSPDFAAYCSAMESCGMPLDVRAVQGLAQCGKFFRLLDAISWACSALSHESCSFWRRPMSLLTKYEVQLGEALREVRWSDSGRSGGTGQLIEEARIQKTLRRIISRLTANSALRDDLMQEALVRLWKLGVEQPGRTRSWYLQNCRFHLLHWLESGRSLDSLKRANGDKQITLAGVGDELVDPHPADDPLFEVVSARDLISTLAGHLQPCEKAVVGGLADGLRLHEIAGRLNLSYPTVLKYRRKIAALTLKLGICAPTRPRARKR